MKMKNIFKLIAAISFVVAISFTGCQKMEITKIIGFIQGHAFDGTTNTPLDSVKVVWSVAGVKDSTVASADDGYIISNLPSGGYSIWYSKANYTTVLVDNEIPVDNSATAVRGGDNREYVVTYNPNLYPLNAGLAGRLYKKENGIQIPISGATVQLDYNTLGSGSEEYCRFIPNLYETTTDADGYYAFSNIPATDVYVRFLEYTDENNEIYYDQNPWRNPINLKANSILNLGKLTLSRLTDGIRLTGSNTFASTGVGTTDFDVASDITLTFNKDVDATSTLDKGYVRLSVGNSFGPDVAITVTFVDNTITINPDEDLSPNTLFTVSYNVYAAQTYDNTSSSISFTTADDAVIPSQVANLGIAYDNMGTGWLADCYTTGIWFSFDRVPNAESYEVYVRDDYRNTEYVKIATTYQHDYAQVGTYYAWVVLPSQFDYYFDDGIQTPFSYGTTVSYKVRAVNSAGEGTFSNVVTVTDETAFDNNDLDISNTQSSSANNTTGATAITVTMNFHVYTGRYADVNVIPNIRIWNGGTEITPLTSTVTWNNHQDGTITFDVPANTDYSGMELRLYNVTDSSGNTMDPNDYEAESLF
jgi:hypothetical protein